MPASGGGWRLDSLVVTRYNASNRPVWDSCHRWNSATNQWGLSERHRYHYYSSGSFAGYDSVIVKHAPLNPSDRQHFFYTNLSGGRLQIEIRDSTLSGGGSWRAGFRYFIWGPRARLEAGGDFDILLIQAFSGSNWENAIRIYNFLSGGRLDSTTRWINVRYLVNLPADLIVRGYTYYYYDASSRLDRKRDTLWLESPSSGPAQAGWTWYFYTGSATRPSKDSTVFRDYGTGVSISVNFYTYDANSNLIRVETDTCSFSNPSICRDYRRKRYSYRQGTSIYIPSLPPYVQPIIPSPVCGGCTVGLTLEQPTPYRIVDMMGHIVAEGNLPAGQTTLPIPSLSGIYTIQIGNYSQKVLILP
ncbi:MAG: T9SS type A sorting domain-containing protein [Bacteroidia bacterium]|nr:T9SS type A sorting domain-containing protein [Bacteroidia bacterium]MDW8235609.1 T9SS type A sorting domain-containing protein [Bacteroidia bacterium]